VGCQVTTDPASKIPIHEGVGTVTSDSLAAESLKGDGSFGQGNPKAAASNQPSSSTTTNTTDTSNATKLNPAVDAEARDAQAGWSEQQQISAGKGLTNTSSGTSGGVTGGYAGAGEGARAPGELRPKGANITEDSELHGKREFGAIGTNKDPSRLAEQEFAKRDAKIAGVSSKGGPQGGDSKFSGLKDESV
jgi:hypothetical protein